MTILTYSVRVLLDHRICRSWPASSAQFQLDPMSNVLEFSGPHQVISPTRLDAMHHDDLCDEGYS